MKFKFPMSREFERADSVTIYLGFHMWRWVKDWYRVTKINTNTILNFWYSARDIQ